MNLYSNLQYPLSYDDYLEHSEKIFIDFDKVDMYITLY